MFLLLLGMAPPKHTHHAVAHGELVNQVCEDSIFSPPRNCSYKSDTTCFSCCHNLITMPHLATKILFFPDIWPADENRRCLHRSPKGRGYRNVVLHNRFRLKGSHVKTAISRRWSISFAMSSCILILLTLHIYIYFYSISQNKRDRTIKRPVSKNEKHF